MNGLQRAHSQHSAGGEKLPLLAGNSVSGVPSSSLPVSPTARSSASGGGNASIGSSCSPGSGRSTGHSAVWIMVFTFACLAGVTYRLSTSDYLEKFVLAIDADPWGSLSLFMAFYIVAVVLFFPTMILQVLSGALYSFYAGLLVSWLATSIGQSLAFLLGRYLFRQSVKAYLLERVPNFPQIEVAMRKEGWKVMALLRLSPVLPYNVLNYAAALTPIPFLSYTLSSSVSVIPWTALYVYLGTFTTDVADLLRGDFHWHRMHGGGMELMSSALYLVLLIITIVYGYILSKRAITSALKTAADDGPGSGSAIEMA